MPGDFSLGSSVVWHLASVAVRALVLAGLAALVMLVLRIHSAAARHAVWTVVVAGMLALAACEPALPPLRLEILRAPDKRPAPELMAGLEPDPGGLATASRLSGKVTLAPRPSWPQAVLAIYMIGVLGFLMRVAFGYLFVRRLVRASHPVEGTEFCESNWISVPLTVGWLRPRILLPAGWERWEDGKLQAVLAHERTHVRRADWAVATMAGLNRCLFWFHPLAWWLERRLASLAEQAADDGALLVVGTEAYAQALLDMAAAVNSAGGRLIWEGMAMANVAEVRSRIERILDETRQIPRGLTRSRWMTLILASLPLIYVTSALQLAPAVAQQPAVPPETARKGFERLTAADAAAMEQHLATDPQDLVTRGRLVLYYLANQVREPRLRHAFWLIENHPESEQAAIGSRGITPRTSYLNDASDYARAATLWRQQAAAQAADSRVLVNAGEFLARSWQDPDEAERLLLAARHLDPAGNLRAAEVLGALYATAILGNAGDSHFQSADANFATRVKLQLENSSDAWVLHFAGASLAAVAQKPKPGVPVAAGVLSLDDHPLLAPVVDLGNRWLARAESLGLSSGMPANTNRTAIRFPLSGPEVSTAAATPPSVPRLIHKVDAVYPPVAKTAKIEGDVRLRVTIGTDGEITHLEIISATAALAEAAIEAVKQWRFTPIPSPVTAEIDVPFWLSPGGSVQAGSPGRPSENVAFQATATLADRIPAPPPLAKSVDPVYPPLARQARVQGTVRLMATINASGNITHLEVMRGHPLLVPAALEAVRQWVYNPVPETGSFEIDVPFVLPAQSDDAAPPSGMQAAPPPIVSRVEPVYPALALQARIQGTVRMKASIGTDGRVTHLEVISGHPLLVPAALESARQWVYSAVPVEGSFEIEVPFTLPPR